MDSNKTIVGNFIKVDDDEDGVLNTSDSCAGTPQGASVDSNGCGLSQLDSDGDGVTDDVDLCEDTSSSAALVSSSGCEVNLFYIDDNGVTIKALEIAEVGMQDEFNGNTYTVLDKTQLKNMIDNGQDISYVVTSKITDMQGLFQMVGNDDEDYEYGDITHWDVSNVTNMKDMFSGAK